MKNISKFWLIAIIAIIGFGLISCDGGNKTCAHVWGEVYVATAPTCVTDGAGTRICTKCVITATIVTIPVDINAHDWDEWIKESSPSCLLPSTGEETRNCKRENCNLTDERTNVVGALGHDLAPTQNVFLQPTCIEKGYGETACSRCEHKEAGAELNALGHKHTNYVSNDDAKCGEDGTKTAICDNDGCIVPDTTADTGSALTHIFSAYSSNDDATCTSNGSKTAICDHDGCTVPDTITDSGTAGHKNVNDVCTVCSNVDSSERVIMVEWIATTDNVTTPFNATTGIGELSLFDESTLTFSASSGGGLNKMGWNSGEDSKYWLVSFNSTRYRDLKLDFRMRSSGTGPRDFKLQYSTDGDLWIDVNDSLIAVGNNINVTAQESFFSFFLPAAINNQATVFLRCIMFSNTSANGGVVAAGGINQINNVRVIGRPIEY